MIKESIGILIGRQDLTREEAYGVMKEIMSGEATPAQIGSLISLLRMKGETIDEITGFARAMREFSVKIRSGRKPLVDTCGTGGDLSGTFNISTASVFVAAGAGISVAKHGNRSVTSKCGSADVLEALGVRIDLAAEKVEECLQEAGIAFLFAPQMHPAMKYAIPVRREIGIRTVFNILGPLTNPADADSQVLGVFSKDYVSSLAQVLKNLGTRRSFVVHGSGLDELTLAGESSVCEVYEGKINYYTFTPEVTGLPRCTLEDLKGGDAEQNGKIILDILEGGKGPKRDVVVLNSALAIIAGGKAKDINEGIKLAEESIDSGEALKKLEKLKTVN